MSQLQRSSQPEVAAADDVSSSLLSSLNSTQSSSWPLEGNSQASNISSSASHPFGPPNQTGAVISKIEDILESIFDALEAGDRELCIPLRTRRAARRAQQQTPTDSQDADADALVVTSGRVSREVVTFPGKTAQEAEKFTRLLSILQFSHEALVSGNIITKRNIFYQNTRLFRSQSVVNELVDDLAFTLGVGRDALNIVAADKGLIAGPIRFRMTEGSTMACDLHNTDGSLVPAIRSVEEIDFQSSRWILVIEKEATFRTLASSGYWRTSQHGDGILVTAKGYPDLATRALLNMIHSERPQMPAYCLVDYDPDGISIFRTYKYGSNSMGHEERATIPSIRWLGLKSSDILGHSHSERHARSQSTSVGGSQLRNRTLTNDETRQSDVDSSMMSSTQPSAASVETLIPLKDRDRQRAVSLLAKICDMDNLGEEEMDQLREVQLMLVLSMKAEIQIVDQMGDIAEWLEERMGTI